MEMAGGRGGRREFVIPGSAPIRPAVVDDSCGFVSVHRLVFRDSRREMDSRLSAPPQEQSGCPNSEFRIPNRGRHGANPMTQVRHPIGTTDAGSWTNPVLQVRRRIGMTYVANLPQVSSNRTLSHGHRSTVWTMRGPPTDDSRCRLNLPIGCFLIDGI